MKTYTSLTEIRLDILDGKITYRHLVEFYLGNIEKNKHFNAFLEVYADEALKQADVLDEKFKIKIKSLGKLAGMVIGIKDVLCYRNHKVSGSSKILEGFQSLYSATAVQRLVDEDAIIIGRLNCDEFAMGGSNENSAYGNVLNPIDTGRVPGGSSGGSAAAVKANLCFAALGTDTGGSVRQPAAFCGVVGFKPTYGRISRYGLLAYASSFDQVGPLTHNVKDASLLLEVMAGSDDYDSTASTQPVPRYSQLLDRKPHARIAYIKECMDSDGVDGEIKQRMQDIITKLRKEGNDVEPVSFPYIDYLVPTYYVLTTAEASSNLSRYGGIGYGYRSANATGIASTFLKSRTEGFGKEVKRRIMLGTFVLSAGYYDAYYARGQKMRRMLVDKTNDIFKNFDFILLPTTPKTAFRFGDRSDPVSMYLEDIFTVLANLTGLPAISLPLGKHSNGMPFGIQLIGKKFEETDLLAFSNTMEEKFGINSVG